MMKQQVDKTEVVSHTKTMRFYPFVFLPERMRTACDRSGANGKEKDYESGFQYYGARYYWSEVLTGWLSVDPMADKYPNISPYAYCTWNPVKLVDPDGMDNVIYLVNLQGRSSKVNANEIVEEGNKYFSDIGLSTRVMLAPDGADFNPAYMDKTDSYAVLGSYADVSAYLIDHMQSGEYKDHFSGWVGGASNPERSSRSPIYKTDAIALDANGLAQCAKMLGETPSSMGAFLIMHGAGHNATLGHADNIGEDYHRSNMGNARIMASGNRIARSGHSLGHFMERDYNSVYIRVMQANFGLNPAVDNYNKNKNPNAYNPYTNCPSY